MHVIEVLISIVAFVVAIGVLIAVHEFGHYLAARLLGMKVLRFSVGFGRPLWLTTAGTDKTEYCLAAIPLGGYVKLLDERDGHVEEHERHRAFNNRPVASRVAVLFAGPAMNFVFAILAYFLLFAGGVPGTRPIIGEITPDSVAESAALESGDIVVAVGSKEVATWDATILAMLDHMLADGAIRLRIQRGTDEFLAVTMDVAGREAELTEPGALFSGLGISPYAPRLPAVIGDVTADGAASEAGIIPGDQVVSADGQPVADWPQWVRYVRARPGETVVVELLRNGSRARVDLAIGAVDENGSVVGRIGAMARVPDGFYDELRAEQKYPLGEAFVAGMARTWEMSTLTVRMLVRMITGDVSVRNISGPINIAQYAGYTASAGFASFLGFLAIVSISLGVLNLAPIPLLDGGQIVYQLAESVKGEPLSERTQIIGQQLGIAALLLIMSFAFYNDISRLFG
jgi:regulator of sigma E protease